MVGPLLFIPTSGTASLPSTDTHVGLRLSLWLTSPPEEFAKAFVSVWIARFGCPQQTTTDQGRQFEARLSKTLATITGSSLTRTTAWHLTSNDMIERIHRQLKASYMCHADEHRAEFLPLVLLGIRSAWKEDLKVSSAELVYGSTLRLQGEFFDLSSSECTDVTEFASRLKVHIRKLSPIPAYRHAGPSTFIFKELTSASHVFRHGALRGTLQALYVGP